MDTIKKSYKRLKNVKYKTTSCWGWRGLSF
jgi:hypothetical protein